MVSPSQLPPILSAHDYVNRKWGALTQTLPLQSVAVGIAATQALKNNPRRLNVEIFNVGNGTVTIGFDPTIVAGNGILIPPLGGSIVISVDEDMDLIAYNVYAIAAAAGNTLWIVETQIA